MAKRLTYRQAVVVWVAHWLKISKQRVAVRYDVDRRRIYEVLQFQKHPRAYETARRIFCALFPDKVAGTVFGAHRRTGRWSIPGQMDFFDDGE